jgi:hypothetical protein
LEAFRTGQALRRWSDGDGNATGQAFVMPLVDRI